MLRVMIHVQHLLGVGHLSRAAQVANALAAAGAEVLLVSGGFPAPQIVTAPAVRRVQLPPLRAADASFAQLLDETGRAIDDAWRARRCELLLRHYRAFRPTVLVVELFPLGRRQLRFELLPLLEEARADPGCRRIACSVRDIVNRRPHREAEALGWLDRFFDMIVVHGDPHLVAIEDSVAGIRSFNGAIIYSGYVGPTMTRATRTDSAEEVLVAAGGGAAGGALYAAAAAARPLSRAAGRPWRFRHAADAPEADIAGWRAAAGDGAVFEPVAADFVERLGRAALAVTQAGYNTTVELMASGVRAVLVPFEGGSETEQARRAARLAPFGYHVVRTADLRPRRLAAAIDAALEGPPPAVNDLRMDGARRSAELLLDGMVTS